MIALNSDIFYVGLGCFIVSFVICKLMVLVNLSDSPNYRSIHNKKNPTGGGLGIIAALGFSLILINTFIPEVSLSKDLPYFLVCAIMISFLGLLDDIFEMRAIHKFTIIIFISIVAVILIGPVTSLPGFYSSINLPYLVGLTGSVLWIFVCINGINFMDGANGLMASFMFLATFSLSIIAFTSGAVTTTIIGLILCFGLLGLLPFNFGNNSKIFAGDTGSLLTGFVFSFSALLLVKETDNLDLLYVGPLLILPFLSDIFITMLGRVRLRGSFFSAHKDHLYQVLIAQNVSHTRVSLAYLAIGMFFSSLTIFFVIKEIRISMWILLISIIIAASVRYFIKRDIVLKQKGKSPKA